MTFIFSNLIFSNFLFDKILNKKNKEIEMKKTEYKPDFDKLNLLIGYDIKTNENIYLPESGLYQNFLITGTIRSGKTSSAM